MKTHFLLLVAILSMAQATKAQTKHADQLLWYKGKMIKPNVLLTATGDTIFYNPKKREVRVVSKGGVGKQFDGMLAELNNTQKRVDALVKKVSNAVPGYIAFDLKHAIEDGFAAAERQWKPLLSNTITIPEGDLTLTPQPILPTGKGGPNEGFYEAYTDAEGKYDAVLNRFRAYWATHQHDDLSSLPVPPSYNFSYCYPCDSIAQQRYHTALDKFFEQLAGTDGEMAKEAFNFCHALQTSAPAGKLDEAAAAANEEAYQFAMKLVLRGAKKAAELVNRYKNDAPRMVAVHQNLIRTARPLQLLGLYDSSALKNVSLFEAYFESIDQYFSNAMAEKDFAVGLNIMAIIQLERERQLMGKTIAGSENLMMKYLAFNQFKLNSNITAKVAAEEAFILGHLRGDNWFYGMVDKASCRLNWVMASKTADDRTAKYKLLAAEAPMATYTGTKDWQSQPPVIKMDFCYKEGATVTDSILANTFHPEGFREKWLFPQGMMQVETLSGILMTSFLDVDRLEQEAKAMNQEKIEKMHQELQDKYAKLAADNPAALVNMTQKMQADMEKLTREMNEMLLKFNPMKYIFTPQVHNKTKDIFKDRLNGKEIFPEHPALEYAWFHLTMEHDPEGPYRIPSLLQLFSISK